jgi:hypothetical protein
VPSILGVKDDDPKLKRQFKEGHNPLKEARIFHFQQRFEERGCLVITGGCIFEAGLRHNFYACSFSKFAGLADKAKDRPID